MNVIKAYKGDIVPIYQDKDLWVSVDQIGTILDITRRMANTHASNLEKLGSIRNPDTCRVFALTRKEGTRQVNRQIKHYSTHAVMLIAFRANSPSALEFQSWAAETLITLQRDGVVYRDKETKQLADSASNQEIAELKAQVAKLQGFINEAHLDMNEGQVPWLGGHLTKRVAYLIGGQRGVRPRAKDLPLVLPALPENTEDGTLSDSLYRIIDGYEKEHGKGIALKGIAQAMLEGEGIRLDKRTLETELRMLEMADKIKRLVPVGGGRLTYHYFVSGPFLSGPEERGSA